MLRDPKDLGCGKVPNDVKQACVWTCRYQLQRVQPPRDNAWETEDNVDFGVAVSFLKLSRIRQRVRELTATSRLGSLGGGVMGGTKGINLRRSRKRVEGGTCDGGPVGSKQHNDEAKRRTTSGIPRGKAARDKGCKRIVN